MTCCAFPRCSNGLVFLCTLPGPYDGSREKSGIHHGQLGPADGLSCHGYTASVSDSATLVMASQQIFPVFFHLPLVLLHSRDSFSLQFTAPSSWLGHLTGTAATLQACSGITVTEMWLILRVLGIKMHSANKRFEE